MTGGRPPHRPRPLAAPSARTAALAALLLAFLLPPERLDDAPILCPFRRATGLPCPTCGLSRSWSATLRGRVGEALVLHPFGPATLVLAAGLAFGRDAVPSADRLSRAQRRGVVGLVLVWLAVWVVRLAVAASRRPTAEVP